jgi:hypothetical protein
MSNDDLRLMNEEQKIILIRSLFRQIGEAYDRFDKANPQQELANAVDVLAGEVCGIKNALETIAYLYETRG